MWLKALAMPQLTAGASIPYLQAKSASLSHNIERAPQLQQILLQSIDNDEAVAETASMFRHIGLMVSRE